LFEAAGGLARVAWKDFMDAETPPGPPLSRGYRLLR